MSIICKEYGWTFQQFLEQPEDFITAINVRMSVEAEEEKHQNEEMQRNAKSRH